MVRILSLLLTALLAALLWPEGAGAQEKPVVVGIMPVHDTTGFAWGEEVAQQMTVMLFAELQDIAGLQPVLLNPGYHYSPLADEWSLEYGRAAGTDLVLITTLLEPDHPKDRDAALRLAYRLLRLATGQSVSQQTARVAMSRGDFKNGLDYGYAGGWFSAGGSRRFDKQPFGRAARSLVQSAASYVRAHAAVPAGSPAARRDSGIGCEISFVIVFVGRNSRSKAYSIIINDREETISMSDGVVRTRVPSGPVLLRATVRDAPYKMPVQPVYQANTVLDCSGSARALALEIESGGQAFLRWK